MNLKSLSLSIAALAVVSAGVYLLNRQPDQAPSDPHVGVELIRSAEVDKAFRLELRDHDKKLSLQRQEDGSWVVPDYYGMPADFQKVSQFASELMNGKVDRFVTASQERISRYEMDSASISLLGKEGQKLWSLALGKSTENGARLLRFNDEKAVYQARINLWLDADAANWVDKSLLSLQGDQIKSLELTLLDGTPLKLSREKKEEAFKSAQALPAGKELKADKVTGLLDAFINLRFTEADAKDDQRVTEALGAHNQRKVLLTTFDGKTITVALDRKPEQKVLKQPESPKDPAKTGPAATLANAAKVLGEKPAAQTGSSEANAEKKDGPGATPLTETIPAGPVFLSISHSDAANPVNASMQKRAFQTAERPFNIIPAKLDDWLQDTPKPAPEVKPAAEAKPGATPQAPTKQP